jgi:glycosyltransferase involved in cell wall biosynthesis
MNVCLVSQEYPPDTAWGGIGTQTRLKAEALVGLGHTVHVLTRTAQPPPSVQREASGAIKVHRLLPPGIDFPIYGRQTYLLGYTWYVLHALSQLREMVELDVIDFPEFGGEGFAYLMDRTSWNWVPVVVHMHGPLAMFAQHMAWPKIGSRFHQFGTFLERMSIQCADALMAGSSAIADLVSQHYNVARNTIDVIHCAVDAERFRPAPEATAKRARPTVLFVGQVVETKGLGTTFEAVLRLRRKYPNIRLQILGGLPKSDLMDGLQERLRAEDAHQNVEMVGFVAPDQLQPYYQQADVFCSPAWFEGGIASVYLEAMACGCPLVVSTAGCGPETICDGETGILVPPNDVLATEAALDRILRDEGTRRRMALACRRRVEDYCTIPKHGGRIVAVYEKAIARSRLSNERTLDNRE